MSFGLSAGDFFTLGSLAWNLYKECKSASAEFREIQNEVISLRTAIQELQDEAENHDSILNRAGPGRKGELNNIMHNCTEVLRELQQLLARYKSLGTNQKRTWDRLKFGSEGVQQVRDKLMFHTSALTLFLTSLGTGSLGRIEKKLDDLAAEIRAGHHEPSLLSVGDEGDSPGNQDCVWRLLTEELSEEFTREEVELYKDEIKSYIRKLVGRGDLEEITPSSDLVDFSDHDASFDGLKQRPSTPKSGGKGTANSLSNGTRWPPQPSVESEYEVDSSSLTEQLSNGLAISESTATNINTRQLGDHEQRNVLDDCSYSEEPPPKRKAVNTIDELFPPFNIVDASTTNRNYVGIDMNVDCCRVAAYSSEPMKESTLSNTSRPDACIIPNEHGNYSTPTYIAFTPDEILVGEDAKQQASRNPENTFFGFTLLLGTFSDEAVTRSLQENSCFQIDNRDGKPAFFSPCRERHYSPEELTAFLIKKMVRIAETSLKQSVARVFISAHSTLTLSRIEAFNRAAVLAKVELPQRIRNSTTAAVYKYVLRHYREYLEDGEDRIILVVNTRVDGYDCSLFEVLEGFIEAKGTSGCFISGISLDTYVSELVCSNFYVNHPEVAATALSPREQTRLMKAIEEARQHLRSAHEAEILIDSFRDGLDLTAKIHSRHFVDAINECLMPGLLSCVGHLLGKTRSAKTKITDVLLLGEMIRIPVVQERLKAWLGTGAKFGISGDPIEDAVLGLALEHANIHGHGLKWPIREEMVVMDCWNSDLYLATHGAKSALKRMNHIRKFGTSQPYTTTLDIYTIKLDQKGLLLRFYSTEEYALDETRLLFELAISLPTIPSCGARRFWLKVDCGTYGGLDITLLDKKTSTKIFELHRLSTGTLTVTRGRCVPITPLIRETWLVTIEPWNRRSRPCTSPSVIDSMDNLSIQQPETAGHGARSTPVPPPSASTAPPLRRRKHKKSLV